MRLDSKMDNVLQQMKDTSEYKGNYYRVHECVASFFATNKNRFDTVTGTSMGFLMITKYLANFCMDDEGVIHAVKCGAMIGKEKHDVVIKPVEVSPVEIEWVEDEVANELNHRESDDIEHGE